MGQQQYNPQCKAPAALPTMPDLIAMLCPSKKNEEKMTRVTIDAI